jgi:hypothetical protein
MYSLTVRIYEVLQHYVVAQAKENETSVKPAQLNDSYTKVVASEPDRVAEEGTRRSHKLPEDALRRMVAALGKLRGRAGRGGACHHLIT